MRGRIVGFFFAAAILLVVGYVAWDYWPVALHYRERRSVESGQSAIHRYVIGQDSLAVTVCRVATELRRFRDLSRRLASIRPDEQGRVVDLPIFLPSGLAANDSRVEAVMRNVNRVSVPENIPTEDRIRIRRIEDSMIRARGFAVVDCPT